MVTGLGPQEKVISPPAATAATTAWDVQLAAVPFPMTVVGSVASRRTLAGDSLAVPGLAVAGLAVAGFAVAGFAVAGFAVAGFAVAGFTFALAAARAAETGLAVVPQAETAIAAATATSSTGALRMHRMGSHASRRAGDRMGVFAYFATGRKGAPALSPADRGRAAKRPAAIAARPWRRGVSAPGCHTQCLR
jgi:hypothetical protein